MTRVLNVITVVINVGQFCSLLLPQFMRPRLQTAMHVSEQSAVIQPGLMFSSEVEFGRNEQI